MKKKKFIFTLGILTHLVLMVGVARSEDSIKLECFPFVATDTGKVVGLSSGLPSTLRTLTITFSQSGKPTQIKMYDRPNPKVASGFGVEFVYEAIEFESNKFVQTEADQQVHSASGDIIYLFNFDQKQVSAVLMRGAFIAQCSQTSGSNP